MRSAGASAHDASAQPAQLNEDAGAATAWAPPRQLIIAQSGVSRERSPGAQRRGKRSQGFSAAGATERAGGAATARALSRRLIVA